MGFSKKNKLLIVDDSAFMRKLISDFFEGSPKIEVIGTARNGKDAIKKIQDLRPDVVTMDIEMPIMNGLDALKKIMDTCPVPVVMLSSTTKQGAEHTLQAMEYGAVDFVTKPSGTISLDLHKVKEELIHKVENAAGVSISKLKNVSTITKPTVDYSFVNSTLYQKKTKKNESAKQKKQLKKEWSSSSKKIVLIGTSTGGPRALQNVITKLPSNINVPILIVQHMPPGFTKSLADRLNQLSKITVKEAEHGDILKEGTAYIAPGGYHLKIRKVNSSFEIVLDNTEPPRAGHRPAVDVMFEEVSKYNDFDKIAVIMTGMGHDGSKGLISLKETGNTIAIAESAESCIVFGMPKAAIETKLVDEVVEVDQIAQTILKYLA